MLGAAGAALLPARSYFEPRRESDVRGWGAVVYEMLTGVRPPADGPLGILGPAGPRSGPSALRPAAQRLALKCLAEPTHTLPTMQQVLSHIRLLALLARQHAFLTDGTAGRPTPPVSPFVVSPPPVETVTPWAPVANAPAEPAYEPRRAASLAARPAHTRSAMLARLAPTVEAQASGEPSEAYDLTSFGQPGAKRPIEPASESSGPCPRCGESTVFVSRPQSVFEDMLGRCRIPICRCHRCYHRWMVVAQLKIGKTLPTGPDRSQKVKKR